MNNLDDSFTSDPMSSWDDVVDGSPNVCRSNTDGREREKCQCTGPNHGSRSFKDYLVYATPARSVEADKFGGEVVQVRSIGEQERTRE
jgi:hypothetical protein